MAGPGSRAALGDYPELFKKQHILIVEGRFYEDIGDALLAGAVAELEAVGAGHDHFVVPGALEIPHVLGFAIEEGLIGAETDAPKYTGVVALGCVIRGETYHFEIVSNQSNQLLAEMAAANAIPVGNAILTVDTHAQALERAVGGRDGKGGDAVRACLKLAEVAARMSGEIS